MKFGHSLVYLYIKKHTLAKSRIIYIFLNQSQIGTNYPTPLPILRYIKAIINQTMNKEFIQKDFLHNFMLILNKILQIMN